MSFLFSLVPVLLMIASVSLSYTSAQTNCTTYKTDLAFLVDVSGSICNETGKPCDDWRACVAFIYAIVNDMVIGENEDRVAMTLFESYAWPQWGLKDYYDKAALLNAIENLRYLGGNTHTVAALNTLLTTFRPENGARPGFRKAAILITDGKPRRGTVPIPMDELRTTVKRVTDEGIQLFAVGITNDIDMDTLMELSSAPHALDQTVFLVKDYQSLRKIRKQLERQNCINDTKKPDVCTDADVDLAFLVDASGSICDTDPAFSYSRHETCRNWNLVKEFLHKIIQVVFIGPLTRVGLVTFRSQAQTVFNLARYTNKEELLSAVDSIAYEKGGETDMTGALRLARKEVFNTAGDRTGSPNVAVIITDGYPTNASTLQAEIDAARNSNIRILALGVTNKVDESTLRHLSGPPQQSNVTYFMALDYVDIESFRKVIIKSICQPSN